MFDLDEVKGKACAIALLLPLATGGAKADNDFELDYLDGRYAFSAFGNLVPPAAPEPTPATAVGVFSFNGDGGCVIEDTINIGGNVVSGRTSLSCEYTLESNGMGKITAFFNGDPGPTPLEFVVIDEDNLRFIRVDLGVAEGVATKQDD